MSLCIRSKANENIKCSFGYGVFAEIRKEISLAYNYELWNIYKDSFCFCFNEKEKREEANKRFNSLYEIANAKTKKIMKFLCTPDVKGSANASTCKMIFDLKPHFFSEEIDSNKKKNWFSPFFEIIEEGCIKGIYWS